MSAATVVVQPPRRCRHCAGFSLDDRSTYASVLVAGDVLHITVERLEQRIIPCVTAVCPDCDQISLISDGSTESMIGSIFMWQRLREWIDTGYGVMDAIDVSDHVVKKDDVDAVKGDAIDAVTGDAAAIMVNMRGQ